jgi:hypothetical protein
MWKVYEIHLEKFQPSIVYEHEGFLIPTSDVEHPYPPTKSFWDGTLTNTGLQNITSCSPFGPSRLNFPMIGMHKENVSEYVKQSIKSMYNSFYSNKCRTFTVALKEWDNLVEVGVALYHGKTKIINEEWSNYLNRLDNLKAFL